jgi:hypothetical protein
MFREVCVFAVVIRQRTCTDPCFCRQVNLAKATLGSTLTVGIYLPAAIAIDEVVLECVTVVITCVLSTFIAIEESVRLYFASLSAFVALNASLEFLTANFVPYAT